MTYPSNGKPNPSARDFCRQIAGAFIEIGRGGFDPATGIGEAVVIEDESAFVVIECWNRQRRFRPRRRLE